MCDEEVLHVLFFYGDDSFPDNIGDDLYVEVCDSKGKSCGRVVVQVASISDVVRTLIPLLMLEW